MMQATVKRVLPIVPLEHIFIATNREYGPLIKEQLPGLPSVKYHRRAQRQKYRSLHWSGGGAHAPA